MTWIATAGVVIALAAASSAAAAAFDPAVFEAFKPGETTRAQVVAALGEPMQASPREGGDTMLYYMLQLADGSGKVMVAVLLDPNGLFKGYRVYGQTS